MRQLLFTAGLIVLLAWDVGVNRGGYTKVAVAFARSWGEVLWGLLS